MDTVEEILDWDAPNIKVISVVWDLDTDKLNCNWEGLNRMEALGMLTLALDAVHNIDYFDGSEEEYEED